MQQAIIVMGASFLISSREKLAKQVLSTKNRPFKTIETFDPQTDLFFHISNLALFKSQCAMENMNMIRMIFSHVWSP